MPGSAIKPGNATDASELDARVQLALRATLKLQP
jgi:hypothetical protein